MWLYVKRLQCHYRNKKNNNELIKLTQYNANNAATKTKFKYLLF